MLMVDGHGGNFTCNLLTTKNPITGFIRELQFLTLQVTLYLAMKSIIHTECCCNYIFLFLNLQYCT